MMRLVPMFDNSGARYSIPEDRVDEFRADMGEVAEARRYRGKDGQHYTIPQDQEEAFKADMPDAVPVRSYTMADGTRRDFTMGEMSKFLRSKEYRESDDYTPPQMGSPTWVAVKGALGGAAEGAYYGGKNALAKVATALPEAAASVGEAVGNVINLGGNARNAVGDWLRASGQQTKRWLGENIRGDQYDENGNLVMSGLTKDLGYEDALTKIGETAGDAAAMAVKFAPAAVAGPAYMETILASDGINAYADTFDRAKAAGYSVADANLAGAASGLINYYGAKLMMKGGAATKDIANPLLRALGGTAFTGAATAAQAVGNKGVENAIEGKPTTEGMLGAAGEGFVEGAQFHLINEVGTNAKQSMAIRRETREMKEMRKENLLTAAETPEGRAFLNTVVQNEGVDAAVKARKEGKDVSRKMGAAADLPDNMSAAERNAVIDGISKAREAQAERVRTKMDDVQAQSLADEIGQNLMGGATDPMFEDIWLNATRRVKNAAELDEPGARARIVGEAIEDVVGKQLDAGPANRTDAPLEKKIAQNRSRIGQEQKAQRKAELDEYERAEQERIAREKAEQDAQMAEDERARAGQLIAEGTEANVPIRESSEYKSWLRKNGRTDTDKNFNRYVAERGLDASLKVERGHNGPNEQTKAELEMGRRIEAQGEAQRANEQSKYDEEMTRREEAKAKAARAAKEKQVADDWAAAEADRKAKAQEASRKGQEERARRKNEMAEYEFGEEVRKAQEAAEERVGKPRISVGEGDVVPPSADSRMKDYPEYASWIKKQGRVNNDKNWNKWVLSNGLDPRLTVERNRGPKIPEKPVRPDESASAPTKTTDTKSLAPSAKPVEARNGANGESFYERKSARFNELNNQDGNYDENGNKTVQGESVGAYGTIASKFTEKNGKISISKSDEKYVLQKISLHSPTSIVGDKARNASWTEGAMLALNDAGFEVGKNRKGETALVRIKSPSPRVPDGKGRMVTKKSWRESKVDEVDADGKPYTEAEKMQLRQDKAMTFIDETFKDSSRKNLEAAIKAFDDIESEGGFGKDSAGASTVSSVRRVARQIATSKFATPDEVARFKEYYEGKPAATAKESLGVQEAEARPAPTAKADGEKAKGGLGTSAEKLRAEEKAARAKFKAEKAEILSEVEKAITKNDGVLSQKSIDGNNLYDAWVAEKKRIEKIEGREKYNPNTRRYELKTKDANELAAAKARLVEIEKDAGHGKDTPTVEIEVGGAKYSVKNDPLSLRQFRENVQNRYGKEASKRYYEINTSTPAQKLADPDFKAWAQKQGRTPTDGARRIYDAQRVDAVLKVAKNWLKGVTMRRTENAAEVPQGARMLYSRDGNVVGWYDRAKKEVVTLPGADAATVAHELGWHATYDYAQAEAAQGRTALLDKLTEYANNAPQSVKNEILRKYGMATDAATLLDEIGAARYTMDNVNKIKDAATRRQTAKWYQRTWNAIADTYKAMLSKMGWNKARLDNLSALTPEQTVNLLADEMLRGKTLGKMKSTQIDMNKGETIAQLHDRKLKDRLRPVEEIEKEAGKNVSNSAHTLFRLLPGKVQGAIDKAQNFAEKVKADCKAAGIKIDELNEFLYTSAASERNAKVLARNGRLDGSAMSHADIQRILTAYRDSPKYAELRRIADEVLAFQRKGFDFRRKAGLISDETWSTLLADEPNHVPMKSRFDPNGEHTGFSLTEQFGKPEWKSAEGRTNVGDGPLEWIVQEYVDAFSRGHENNARRALLETVLAHPEVGEVRKLGPNDALGEVKRKGQQGDPNVFVVKTDGDTYQVKLNGTRGELIARAVSGRGLVRAPQSVQKAMRWWSSTATSWSPTFAGRNFIADTADVFAVNIGENGLVKGTSQFGKHVYTALKLTNAIRKYASTGETTNPLIREAVDAGVLMGGGVRGQAFADAGESALKTLKTDWGNGKNRVKAVRNAMFGWIDTLNQTAELMNRMADYKMQREAGKSKNEAALHAREITVDFNEKGELTPVTNVLYMFSNSTLGATMRLNKAIFASKEGKSLAAGLFAYGLVEGMAEALTNGDDEDGKNMNEYTRANSFYFRKGSDIYRIPLHASPISVIKYAGNCTARKLFGTLNGDKAVEQVAKDMIGMMTSYLGIGALGDNEAASIAPTIVQPFLQAYMNRDFADRPIERTSFSEEKPKSENGRPSTPQFYKDLAKWLNGFGGGNAGRKGEFLGVGTDFSPEMLKHFSEATGKNALRDIENTVELAKMVLGRSEWDRRNVPVGRDYYRTTGGNDNRYFEAVRAYKTDASDLRERSDKADYLKTHPWLREGSDGKTTVNRLINMANRDNPRSGIGSMGITQLRKLTEGKVRRKDGTYFEPNTPISDELKEKAKEMLQKRQARVIEIMGK